MSESSSHYSHHVNDTPIDGNVMTDEQIASLRAFGDMLVPPEDDSDILQALLRIETHIAGVHRALNAIEHAQAEKLHMPTSIWFGGWEFKRQG